MFGGKSAHPIGIYILIVTFLAIIILCVLSTRQNPVDYNKYDASKLKWYHEKPAERLIEAIAEFGEPSYINYNINGSAVWNREVFENLGLIWERMEIRDHEIYHDKPTPHCDFWTATILYDIPVIMRPDVLRISESIMYDPLTKELYARCHFMGANIATLLLATKMVDGDITLDDILSNDEYAKTIKSTVDEPSNISILYDELHARVVKNDAKSKIVTDSTRCTKQPHKIGGKEPYYGAITAHHNRSMSNIYHDLPYNTTHINQVKHYDDTDNKKTEHFGTVGSGATRQNRQIPGHQVATGLVSFVYDENVHESPLPIYADRSRMEYDDQYAMAYKNRPDRDQKIIEHYDNKWIGYNAADKNSYPEHDTCRFILPDGGEPWIKSGHCDYETSRIDEQGLDGVRWLSKPVPDDYL